MRTFSIDPRRLVAMQASRDAAFGQSSKAEERANAAAAQHRRCLVTLDEARAAAPGRFSRDPQQLLDAIAAAEAALAQAERDLAQARAEAAAASDLRSSIGNLLIKCDAYANTRGEQ